MHESPASTSRDEPAKVRQRIGVALQEAALDDLMTGRELIELQATLHGIAPSAVRDRGQLLIDRVGLTGAQERRVGTYSGGMRRRLDLAMALIHDPEVLFLDEPTTGLDPTSRLTLWEEVRRLKGEGTTVFLTTQYLEEADQLADRVGIIASGELVAEGTPSALKAEVGQPHLEVCLVDDGELEAARTVLTRFGGQRPPAEGSHISVALADGAAEIAPVVIALSEAGVMVASLELVEPTLDDVFMAKTGHHLEGADSDEVDGEAGEKAADAALGTGAASGGRPA